MAGFTSSYSSALASNSATFTRLGGSGSFYDEILQVNCTVTGSYTITSSSSMDTYGYLYADQIYSSSLSSNLLTSDDDSNGGSQFLMTYTLQAGRKYLVIFTTYNSMTTGSFSMSTFGPGTCSVNRVYVALVTVSPSTSYPYATWGWQFFCEYRPSAYFELRLFSRN